MMLIMIKLWVNWLLSLLFIDIFYCKNFNPELINHDFITTAVLEEILGNLEWEGRGIRINGQPLSNLRFADDTVALNNNIEELGQMSKDVNKESNKVGLIMNISKTSDNK